MNGLILSIFPGLDLLGRAFEEAGYCVVRGPDLLWGGDIRGFHAPAGAFEGVIGGPPCPEWSTLRGLIAAHGYKTRHGNMIPEFVRVVAEAAPAWFLMEEGPLAPVPRIEGYAVDGFYLNPVWLGEEQSRKRRIAFGIRGETAINLRRHIQYAALQVAKTSGAVYSKNVINDPQFKGRVVAPAVTHDPEAYPIHKGGSGKLKVTVPAVLTSGSAIFLTADRMVRKTTRRSWEECCRLQGLPGDFLKDAPFTVGGKREALGNGIPLPMGRALAKAVRKAMMESRVLVAARAGAWIETRYGIPETNCCDGHSGEIT